jgi:UDP-N-acetyl-D-glucosamine dehydrogenase
VNVSVIGQGYVGLPVALAISHAGYKVIGIDSNSLVVSNLNNGKSHIEDVEDFKIQLAINSGNYLASSELVDVNRSDIVVVCLPTPLFESKIPNLKILENAVIEIAKNLKPGTLVIIESTIQPGTTRNLILPLLIKNSTIGMEEFDLAFSPERIDPKNSSWNLENTPKLVAGLTERSSQRAMEFYSSFVKNVHLCESVEIAETAKLLENSFRLINISFVNELAMFCERIEIDVRSVISAASTKPYGFMAFYPGIGVGGHCIPVDPIYLSHKAKEVDIKTRIIDAAVEINKEMPDYIVRRAEKKIGPLKGKKILVVGVAYKPNISDTRETPVEALVQKLEEFGALVSWHDDLVKVWNGTNSVELKLGYDLAILATHHAYVDISKLEGTPLLNARDSL